MRPVDRLVFEVLIGFFFIAGFTFSVVRFIGSERKRLRKKLNELPTPCNQEVIASEMSVSRHTADTPQPPLRYGWEMAERGLAWLLVLIGGCGDNLAAPPDARDDTPYAIVTTLQWGSEDEDGVR